MTDKAKLLELAERCEKAAGPDRELDFAMHVAIRTTRKPYQTASDRMPNSRKFTASQNAAMTLMSDNWHVALRGINRSWTAVVTPTDGPVSGRCCGFASSPALALCAAALKARAS